MAILSRMSGSFDYELWFPEFWIQTTLCLYKLVVVDISLWSTRLMLITSRADFYFPCDIFAGLILLSLCLVCWDVYFFVLSSCKGSLSVLETSPLSDGTWQIFSPRSWLGFPLLRVAFCGAVLVWMKPTVLVTTNCRLERTEDANFLACLCGGS